MQNGFDMQKIKLHLVSITPHARFMRSLTQHAKYETARTKIGD
jgi:hypothetical protein